MAPIIGIIGGTGLYSLDGIEIRDRLSIDTPFGPPSSPITKATLDGTELLFLARHGEGHTILPSELNSRANIYALKSLGASWCISVSAVGSLREEYSPGHFVIPDQLIDRTNGRQSTFFGEGLVGHVSFADPFCPVLSRLLYDAALAVKPGRSHFGGTYLCMEGPAFSTRAESHLYRSWGASIIGMTALPEAKLAREAEISYAVLAAVTDYDCWRSSEDDVDVDSILAVLHGNAAQAKAAVSQVVRGLRSAAQPPAIADALRHAILTDRAKIPAETLRRLGPIIGRYIPPSG